RRYAADPPPRFAQLSRRVAATGEPVLVAEVEPRGEDADELVAPRSLMLVPLAAPGRTIGVLAIASSRRERRVGGGRPAPAGGRRRRVRATLRREPAGARAAAHDARASARRRGAGRHRPADQDGEPGGGARPRPRLDPGGREAARPASGSGHPRRRGPPSL